MGRPYLEYLEDDSLPRYKCAKCSVEVASSTALVWEGFMGAQQPALLFRSTINVEPYTQQREERLSSGLYTLVGLRCRQCRQPLGWQYVKASNLEQKYKEGCALLQTSALIRVDPEGAPEPLPAEPSLWVQQQQQQPGAVGQEAAAASSPAFLEHLAPRALRRAASGTTFCPPII